jgi:hypothetical protein
VTKLAPWDRAVLERRERLKLRNGDQADQSNTGVMGKLNDEGLNLLFREARTYSTWLNKPVSDKTLQELYELTKWGPEGEREAATSTRGWSPWKPGKSRRPQHEHTHLADKLAKAKAEAYRPLCLQVIDNVIVV